MRRMGEDGGGEDGGVRRRGEDGGERGRQQQTAKEARGTRDKSRLTQKNKIYIWKDFYRRFKVQESN